MIATAPGKLVLWGEYAVLAGAPAAVMAVDRRARISIETAPRWQFTSAGLLTPGLSTGADTLPRAETSALAVAALQHFGCDRLPAPGQRLHSDTRAFFHQHRKLGLGSSAALAVATTVAIGQLVGIKASLADALGVHRRLQPRGSGLDVACSWHGGTIRFSLDQSAAPAPLALPDNLHWAVVYTGTAAVTAAHLNDFSSWCESADTSPLEALGAASRALFDDPGNLAAWRGYIARLAELDAAATLNIFTKDHHQLATIATAHDLVYKPCGAGGGDVGIAVGADPSALAAFRHAAQAATYVPLDLEIATDGVRLSD